MSQIRFTPPGPDTRGYLRRQEKALELFESLESKPTAQLIRDMVDFLLDHVTEPADRQEARDALMDATEAQFKELLVAVTRGSQNGRPLVNPSDESSDSTSEATQPESQIGS